MVSRSYLFPFPRYWPKRPIWLTIGLNSGIFGSERDKNYKPLLWERNGRIYGGRAKFQGCICFCSKDIGQKGHFGYPLSPIWALWDLNEIMTSNHFYGSVMAAFMGQPINFCDSLVLSLIIRDGS